MITISKFIKSILILTLLANTTASVAWAEKETVTKPVVDKAKTIDQARDKQGSTGKTVGLSPDNGASKKESTDKKVVIQGRKVELEDIGSRVTARSIPKIGWNDFTLAGLRLGYPYIGKFGQLPVDNLPTVKGDFTTYTGKSGSYTLYGGPTRRDSDALRRQGLEYKYYRPTLVNVHVTSEEFATARGIQVGDSRGEVLFSYGSPRHILRNPKDGKLIFFYTGVMGKEKNIPPYWLAIAMSDNKVSSIDIFDKQVLPHYSFATKEGFLPVAGELTDKDFSIAGYQINDSFKKSSHEPWLAMGELYHNTFLSYEDYLVSYDTHNLISRVVINRRSVVTPRGITIGDSKYLLLYLYGKPNFIEPWEEKSETLEIYTYTHPMKSNAYLLFAVDKKTGFIKTILLSDRKMGELKS